MNGKGMVSQVDRKLRTRKALMDSALALVAEGSHYSSLSLREVAKRAGVVPNAFYRHFKDLDELGLALADQLGLLLRQIMRQARLQGLAADSMISDSVNFYIEHVQKDPALFRFMAQSITGGSPAMREAMRNELGHFAKEMVMDMSRLGMLTHISGLDMDMLGHLVIQTVFGTTTEVLDLPESSANMIEAIRERTIKQGRLIFLGASVWDTKSEKQKKLEDKANRKKKKP
jgi:AcrR family transcriptional regulator